MSSNNINLLLGIIEAIFLVPLWDIILSFSPWYNYVSNLILDDFLITLSIVFIIIILLYALGLFLPIIITSN